MKCNHARACFDKRVLVLAIYKKTYIITEKFKQQHNAERLRTHRLVVEEIQYALTPEERSPVSQHHHLSPAIIWHD